MAKNLYVDRVNQLSLICKLGFVPRFKLKKMLKPFTRPENPAYFPF